MSRSPKARLHSQRFSLPIDAMEPRVLLSAAKLHPKIPAHWKAHSNVMIQLASPLVSGSSTPIGLAPSQVRGAYGVPSISFNGVAGNGAGQTIAIIDAYDDPNALSDLDAFDAKFGLANPPSFTKLNETGGTSLPPTAYSAGQGTADGDIIEESIDVQWAHVMAPDASIILYEAASLGIGDLTAAAETASANSTVSVVSMSWGGSQFNGEVADAENIYFTNPNITYLAATGDDGTPAGFPATAPNVVAVGGTSLTVNGTTYSSETGWDDKEGASAGGIDLYDAQPSYQTFTVSSKSTTKRTTPDVSILGDPDTGVPIYDSYDFGTSDPWLPGTAGGTSLSAPLWAGLIADADQGRALEGLSNMGGLSTTLPRLYQLPSSNYHDITTGSNGYSAGVGYDLVTGIGTPIANLLVPDLSGAGTITGRVFVDDTGSGVYGGNDTPLAGATVFLDLNNDGSLNNNEPSTTTNALGIYTFTNEPAGGTVRLSSPTIAGYIALPVSSATIKYGATDTINFTYFPTTFSTTTAATNYTLQTDATGTIDQILVNNALTYSIAKSLLGSSALTFSLTGSGDSLTINAANGNPLTAGGVTLTGASGGDDLNVTGTATGNDTFVATSTSINFDGDAVNFSSVALLTLDPGSGNDSLTVNSGSVTVAAQTPGDGILNRNFSSLSVASGGSLLFANSAANSDRTLVQTSSLSDSGQLDLGGNDMIVHNGNLAAITQLLAGGYSNGSWNGQGIASSAAHNDTTFLTALGVISNNNNGGTFFGGAGQAQFDGVDPAATDILIKYTYYGDANLDGQVDATDYSRIDNGYLTGATGWANGDFNYDGQVNGTDYTLVDNAYNMQGLPL